MSEFSIFARSIQASKGFEKEVSKCTPDDGKAIAYLTIESVAELPEEPRVIIHLKDAETKDSKGFLAFDLYRDEAVEFAKVLLMMFDYESKK